jgi:hypothetical protein
MLSIGHMRTESQNRASRENGAKSHGATTPEGKLASSRNALKHGLLAETIVLQCESTDRFLELVVTLHEEFQPQTPFEETLIENMAVARWRLMRIHGMETAGIDYEMRKQAEMSDSISAEDPATRASLTFRTLSDDSRSLELISRYEARYDRQYYRAYRCFNETRDRRTPPSAQTPQPDGSPLRGPQPAPAMPIPPAVPQNCPQGVPQSEPENVILPFEPKPPVLEKVDAAMEIPANKRPRTLKSDTRRSFQNRRRLAFIRIHQFSSAAKRLSSHVHKEITKSKGKG